MLGIDPSLTCTGMAYRGPNGLVTISVPTDKMRGAPRLAYIRRHVARILQEVKPSLVVLEGYSMGSSRGKSRLADLGELGGVLRLLLWENGHDYYVVPPASLKKAVTGKGRAEKPDMLIAMSRVFGNVFHNSDEVDAAGLMLIGELALLEPPPLMPNTMHAFDLQCGERFKGRDASLPLR